MARTIHPLLVGDLADICVDLIDRQARPSLEIAGVLNLDRPLFAGCELDVVQGLRPIHILGLVDQTPKVDGLVNAVISQCVGCFYCSHIAPFLDYCIQLPANATAFLGLDTGLSLTIMAMYRNASAPWEYWSCLGFLLNIPVSGSTS